MKKILLCSLLLISLGSRACLNLFAVDSSGRTRFLEHSFFSDIAFDYSTIENNLKKLEKKFSAKDFSVENISDYGAYLLMSGQFAKGLDIYRALITKYPDKYEIIANTAVAYELNGNIDSALYWEKKAIEQNPHAHGDSEWIHLKILEARIQLRSNPDWCLYNNVTGIEELIRTKYRESEHEFGPGAWYFQYFIQQLSERLPFTNAGDKVMGKLMYELGEAYQAASTYRAYYCYALAKWLYPELAPLADARMRDIKARYPKGSVKLEGSVFVLGERKRLNDETTPPEDSEVKAFIQRLIDRPAIKKRNFKTITVEQLIAGIK